MRNVHLIVFLFFGALFLQSPLWALDAKELSGLIEFADTAESYKKALQVGLNNPELLEQILFFSDSQIPNRTPRGFAIAALAVCVKEKKYSQDRFLGTVSNLLANIDKYVSPQLIALEKVGLCVVVGNFGFDHKQPLEVRLRTFKGISDALLNNKLINNQLLHGRIISQTDKAIKFITNSGKGPAEVAPLIEAMAKDVALQQNKQLTPEAAKIISIYCDRLLDELSKEP